MGLADTKGYSQVERITVVADRGPFEMVPHWLLFDRTVSALGVRLYLVLRQHADANAECYPSRQRLADLMGVSLPTVDRAREQLVSARAICMHKRTTADGRQTSCLYHVHWAPQAECSWLTRFFTGAYKESYIGTNTHLTHTSTSIVSPEGLTTRSEQSASNGIEVAHSMRTTRKRGKRAYSADFETWWGVYPRKAAKRAAFIAFEAALQQATLETLLTGARRLASDPNREPRYTPYPATWLRQERWQDDPLPASVTVRTGGERRMEGYARMYENLRSGELEQ